MSMKNYNKVLCLQNLTTGKIYTINDYYRLEPNLRQQLLLHYLNTILDDTDNVKVFVNYITNYDI